MSILTTKYTPAAMRAEELEATFAARQHTVDYLLKQLRAQIHSGTLSSFVITGPRGAGKSTLIQMVALRIRQDTELSAAWIPVVFPEEQFNMATLRDLLAAILQNLAVNIPAAAEWLAKVEAEPNEEQSQQLAITGLREVTRAAGKRLVVFIENLNQLLGENMDDLMKGTLRRLLMSDPFMMVIGSSVHIFDSLKDYDEAFFNYFGQVPLDRLNSEQVSELLRKRATYDRNDIFLRDLPKQQAKIHTFVHLTGGNPRFVLMLYELLNLRQVTTTVQYLHKLVDELTPLLKHEIENLPPQQRKIIHALMEKGGTAQPTDLTSPTRLALNMVTAQLKRLKEAQIVEVLGGGKGKAAHYTVPDKLFSIWYQMRYLRQNRRRIELFVEVLRVWFEEEERIETLRELTQKTLMNEPYVLREQATTAEYFAASLKGTVHESLALDLCIGSWIKADIKEAAFAYYDLRRSDMMKQVFDETAAQFQLAGWLSKHDDARRAIETLDLLLANSQLDIKTRAQALVLRACSKELIGDGQGAIADATSAIQLPNLTILELSGALTIRAIAKHSIKDYIGALEDNNKILLNGSAVRELIPRTLINRAFVKRDLSDLQGALLDFSTIIEGNIFSKDIISDALFNRALLRGEMGDVGGEISDYTDLINLEGAPDENAAQALVNRAVRKEELGDNLGAVKDSTAVMELKNPPKEQVAMALINRARIRGKLLQCQESIVDFTTVINMRGIHADIISRAYVGRGMAELESGNNKGAIDDFTVVIQCEKTKKKIIAHALDLRGRVFLRENDMPKAMADWFHCIELGVAGERWMVLSAIQAFGFAMLKNKPQSADTALSKFTASLVPLARSEAYKYIFDFFYVLASPEMKEAWPAAYRKLYSQLKPEIVEAVTFLEPVCQVLEGKERTLLDALPPEQREFALKVLAKFEPKKD